MIGYLPHFRFSRLRPVIWSLLLLSSYCLVETGHAQEPRTETLVLSCSEVLEFTVKIEGESAWAYLPGQTRKLQKQGTSRGLKFADSTTVLWIDGKRSALSWRGQFFSLCTNNNSAAVWEDAKLRGIHFRATGNEPGWYLEIGAGNDIHFSTSYGLTQAKYKGRDLKVEITPNETFYRNKHGMHEFKVSLTPGPCVDDMSGEIFETIVIVTLNDHEFRGCGRALN